MKAIRPSTYSGIILKEEFGTTSQFGLNLQNDYDLYKNKEKEIIEAISPLTT